MAWKFVIIAVAMVLSSIIIGGAIIVSQAIANNNLDFGDDGEPQESPVMVEGIKVSIARNSGSDSYDPNPIEINANETVTWVNDDSAVHTATANDGTFDSDILRRGEVFSFTFKEEGEFPYYCELHPNMKGTVVVK